MREIDFFYHFVCNRVVFSGEVATVVIVDDVYCTRICAAVVVF